MATVLLATDDGVIHSVLDAELTGLGHKVLWAVDGQDAYDQCLVHQPEVVFLTPSLPVFDGYACCELLREDPEVPRDLPILLLTDDEPNPHTFDRTGFTGRFPETHSMQELRERMSGYVGTRIE